MATTTKKDLIDRIADTTQQKRSDVKRTVQAFLDQVIDELGQGNRLEFRDFGVFEIKERAPRMAQNPKTLERVHVPARKTVKFKVGRLMRETLEDHSAGPQVMVELKSEESAEVDPTLQRLIHQPLPIRFVHILSLFDFSSWKAVIIVRTSGRGLLNT